MYANEPEMAEKWSKEEKKGKFKRLGKYMKKPCKKCEKKPCDKCKD